MLFGRYILGQGRVSCTKIRPLWPFYLDLWVQGQMCAFLCSIHLPGA